MARKYALAGFLPEETRRAMCAADYAEVFPQGSRRLVDGRGCCPMGVAMRERGLHRDYLIDVPTPESVLVAEMREALGEPYYDAPEAAYAVWEDAVTAALAEFIEDWDAGVILPADLPRVLGLAA